MEWLNFLLNLALLTLAFFAAGWSLRTGYRCYTNLSENKEVHKIGRIDYAVTIFTSAVCAAAFGYAIWENIREERFAQEHDGVRLLLFSGLIFAAFCWAAIFSVRNFLRHGRSSRAGTL